MRKQRECPKIKYMVMVLHHSGPRLAGPPHRRSLTLAIVSGYTGSRAEFILCSEVHAAFGGAKLIRACTNMALYM
jgi:hypothetical protein